MPDIPTVPFDDLDKKKNNRYVRKAVKSQEKDSTNNK
jgi:hypothetical protein